MLKAVEPERCPACGNHRDPVRALYDELRNDQATWTDAVFWMLVGVFCGWGAQQVVQMWPK